VQRARSLYEKAAAKGAALHVERRLKEAAGWYELALRGNPDDAEVLSNYALALHQMHRFKEAIWFHNLAVAHAFIGQVAEIRFNRAVTLLVTGDFKQGLDDLEWMWRCPRAKARSFKKPAWDGSLIEGKTLLVHCDQGYGDTLQFCRYAEKVANLGVDVILEAPLPLVDLLCTLCGDFGVIARGEEVQSWDYECRLMSLPRLLGTTIETIPSEVPYLWAPAPWPHPLPTGKPKIGLVWSGRPAIGDHANDWMRQDKSFPCETYAPLLELDCYFFSLQKDHEPIAPIIDLMPQVSSFADTAALVDALDLVISADAAVAHLAGAMGKPVWLVNPYNTAWRWLLDRENSPWYPTMRIFRQSSDLDWKPVIGRVKNELERFFTWHGES
jgi:hypothetical protein